MNADQLIVVLVLAIWLIAIVISVVFFIRNRRRAASYAHQSSQAQTILEILRYQSEQRAQENTKSQTTSENSSAADNSQISPAKSQEQ